MSFFCNISSSIEPTFDKTLRAPKTMPECATSWSVCEVLCLMFTSFVWRISNGTDVARTSVNASATDEVPRTASTTCFLSAWSNSAWAGRPGTEWLLPPCFDHSFACFLFPVVWPRPSITSSYYIAVANSHPFCNL